MNEQLSLRGLWALVVIVSTSLAAMQAKAVIVEQPVDAQVSPAAVQDVNPVSGGSDGPDVQDVTIRPTEPAPQALIEQTQDVTVAESGTTAAPILDGDSMQLGFQALLRDNDGVPLAGPVDLTFNIYAIGGGLIQGPIVVRAVPLVNGVADTTFPVAASSFDGTGRELGVRVNAGAEMSPRIPLVTVPYALRVDRVKSEELDDVIELGSAAANGQLSVWNATNDVQSIQMTGSTAQIETYGSDGLLQIRLWGLSFGEMYMNDLDNNDEAVRLGATRFGLPPIVPFSDSGGRLQLRNGVGTLRAQLSAPTSYGLLTLYNAADATALQAYANSVGAGLLSLRDADGTVTALIEGAEVAEDGAQITLRSATGVDTVFIDAQEGSGAALRLADELGNQKIIMDAQEGTAGGGVIYLYNNAGIQTIEMDAEETDSASAIRLRDSGGVTRITLDPEVTGGGRVITPVLQITGGSDLSEQFDIGGDVKPGMVVSIDPTTEGKLAVATTAYDKRVAGIVSGAGGVLPGMLMGHEGTVANGAHAVALTGRVFAFADEANGAIVAGDLLTTSTKPGHCMKVTDHGLAQGAIIGKAMGRVKDGMVLVLVNLQ